MGLVAAFAAVGIGAVATLPPASATGLPPAAARQAPPTDAPAVAETRPVEHPDDAADDPAIGVHPTDPELSVVIGTDTLGALEVYNLNGERIQQFTGITPNNVDVVDGRRADDAAIVGAADDTTPADGVMRFWRIDPGTGQLTPLDGIVNAGGVEHGFCMGRLDGELYAFAVPRNGEVEQWRITVSGSNVSGSKVRGPISTGDGSEGCVVDEANRALYVAQGPTGIWRIGAGPTDPTEKVVVDTTGPAGQLVADVEGLTVVDDYLLASSQGDNSFVAYERRGGAFVGKLSVVAGDTADGCEETDGIEATRVSLNDRYPHGLFVCQDGLNGPPGSSGNQNFKFVRLENVVPLSRCPGQRDR